MKVVVLGVGRPKGPTGPAIDEYERRASRYWKFESMTVDAGAQRGKGTPDLVRDAEARRILARLPASGEVVALTRDGKPGDSVWLSKYLQEQAIRSVPSVTFVIGGAFGLGPDVLARATRRLSLSAMTLPHDLARLVLTEQIYRAGTISRNEPYHKGTGK